MLQSQVTAQIQNQMLAATPIILAQVETRPLYKADVPTRGVRRVLVPGTHMGDIRGYPVDRKPDIGAYEYSAPTCNEDITQRIISNMNDPNPETNFGGDLNWDGVVDYEDYWILASWWVNYDTNLDPNTIIPYPMVENKPPLII